jgi:hypothetical protein
MRSASLVFPDSAKRKPFDRDQQVDSQGLIAKLDDQLFSSEIPLDNERLSKPNAFKARTTLMLFSSLGSIRISMSLVQRGRA